MKKYISTYISQRLECQRLKIEHKDPASLLHPLHVLEWKWVVVTIDFITKLPRQLKQPDSIIVVVENFTKSSLFVRVQSTFKVVKTTKVYM